MQINIEIREIEMRTQETKRGNTLYWQKAGYIQGDDWPVVFEVFCPDGRAHPVGRYTFHGALKADQWGSLVIDPFNSKLVPQK